MQNVDPSLPNYGEPATSLGRIDINGDRRPQETDEQELARLRALGYVEDDAEPEPLRSDLMHTNAVQYNPELDQIVLSVPRFNEIWIIDHSTTTAEAAGRAAGDRDAAATCSTAGAIRTPTVADGARRSDFSVSTTCAGYPVVYREPVIS